MTIESINFEIIDICNLQCTMCSIWENKEAHFLTSQQIQNCIGLFGKNLDITLTGGEPFLHPNLTQIIQDIQDNGYAVSTISTNGILKDKILSLVDNLKKQKREIPAFHISIDGYSETHDRQRGVSGSFKKSLETIYELKKRDISVKLKYTITKQNIFDIKKCFELANKLCLEILFKTVDNDKNYTNRGKNTQLLHKREKEYVSKILLEIKQDPFTSHLVSFLKTGELPFLCTTPEISLFIMANGDVYPCTKYTSIGNVGENSLENIVGNSLHLDIIREVKEKSCSMCFSPHGSSKKLLHGLH